LIIKKYPLVEERFSALKKYFKDKDVLDCGCVEHKVYSDKAWWDYLWIHDKICKEAKFCLGVDIEKDELEKLKKKGYNVTYADVETMKLNRKFDVVFAGELIEHLGNPGAFLERVNLHLRKGGILILTTPNAFAVGILFRSLLGRAVNSNPQHVCFYDLQTLRQLLERYGFQLEDVYWHVRPEAYKLNFLVKFRPSLAPTIIAAARKVKDAKGISL
jgi:2-polyprenyl-3-methyl-5-hydroxy-6-metoxy-1,4-benzoquinol methylase